jgi:hypothetical protein
MPRRKNIVPTENLDVYVPKELAKQVRDRLYDPRVGRAAYGAISTLVTQLLRDWVKSQPLNPKVEELKKKEAADVLSDL